MFRHTPFTILTCLLCIAFNLVKAQNGEIFIYSILDNRQTDLFDKGYTLDGTQMIVNSREKLLSIDNFGPTGVYGKMITIVDQYADSGSIASVTQLPYSSIFFFGTFNLLTLIPSKAFTPAEIDSLYAWSKNGGKLIVANSGFYADVNIQYDARVLASKWGVDYQNQVPSPLISTEAGANTSIFNGPFGSLIGANQGGGIQSYFSLIPENSIVLATDFESNPTLIIDCNTLDLIIADVDAYTSVGGVSRGPLVENAQDIFWTNTIVFMDQLQGIPKIVHYRDSLVLAETYNNYLWYRDGVLVSNESFIQDVQPGAYQVDVTTNGGCVITSETFDVGCYSLPKIDLGRDTLLCRDNSLLLKPFSQGTFLWQDQSKDSVFLVTKTGEYWVKVTNECGTSIDSIFVEVKPSLDLGNDTTICLDQPFRLSANIENAQYSWSNGSTLNNLEVQSSGLFWLEVTDSCGVSRDSINIIAESQITLNLGADTTLCTDSEFILDATVDNANYLWQDGSTLPIYKVTNAGTYTVRVDNTCGSERDAITIKYFDQLDLGLDQEICEGSEIILNAALHNATYLWEDGSTDSTLLVDKEGEYAVSVKIPNCKAQSDTVLITTKPNPTIVFDDDRVTCFQDKYELDARLPNASYLWGDGFKGPIYEATEEGLYYVRVTVDGCSTVASIKVTWELCPVKIVLPNAFSPNNDGINDTFAPKEMENIASMNTKIFDRTGSLVFETKNDMIDWNGESCNGNQLPTGIYYYQVTLIGYASQVKSVRGVVSLLY